MGSPKFNLSSFRLSSKTVEVSFHRKRLISRNSNCCFRKYQNWFKIRKCPTFWSRHFGVIIGSHHFHFKEKYVANLNNQLQLLSKIGKTEPQPAYTELFWWFCKQINVFYSHHPQHYWITTSARTYSPTEIQFSYHRWPFIFWQWKSAFIFIIPYRRTERIIFFQESSRIECKYSRIITKQLTDLIVKQEPIQSIRVKFQYYKEK